MRELTHEEIAMVSGGTAAGDLLLGFGSVIVGVSVATAPETFGASLVGAVVGGAMMGAGAALNGSTHK